MRQYSSSIGFIKRAFLFDFMQFHVDLFGKDGDRVSSQTGYHHGAKICDVRTFAESSNSAPNSVLNSVTSIDIIFLWGEWS